VSAAASPVISDTAVRTVAFAARNRPRRGTAARLVWIEPVEYSDVMARTPSTPMASWARARPLRLTEVGSYPAWPDRAWPA
jgi:hypothetical protein